MTNHRSPYQLALLDRLVRTNCHRNGAHIMGRRSAVAAYRKATGLPLTECRSAVNKTITDMEI